MTTRYSVEYTSKGNGSTFNNAGRIEERLNSMADKGFRLFAIIDDDKRWMLVFESAHETGNGHQEG